MICCCPDAEGSLQTGVGRNISGSLCEITKWFLEIQGRLKTENSARATIGLPNKRVAYGGSFLLKGSVLCVECDLECGAAPRCCQHWHRLFAILFDNLCNRCRCRTEPLSRQATVLFQASNLSSSEVSRLDFVLSESGRLFRASQFHQRDPCEIFL